MTKSRCILLAASLLLAGTTGLSAQARLSVQGGVSIATWRGDERISGYDSRTGISVGASVLVPLREVTGVQVGAHYVQKGFDVGQGGGGLTMAVDYVEVPVLLRVALPTPGMIRAHVLAGGAVAFKVDCGFEVTRYGRTESGRCEDMEAPPKSFDAGVVAGAGLDVAVTSTTSVVLDVLYDFGLTESGVLEGPVSAKNRAWLLTAGISLPLG